MVDRSCIICSKSFCVKYNSSPVLTCSKTCASEKRKMTNKQLYGHVSNLHGTEKVKIQQNLFEKYGVSNVSQIPSVKLKKQETCLKNFGTRWPMQSQVVKNKSVTTLLNTYGVTNISHLTETIHQIQDTLHTPSEKYGGLTPFQAGVQKMKANNLQKYGVEYYVQSQEFIDKTKESIISLYGVDSIFQTDYFHQLMISKGYRYAPHERSARDEYYAVVHGYTKKSLNHYGELIAVDLSPAIVYNVDHIFSISQGFKNGIDPKIIGSIVNLQIIPESVNKAKKDDCWIDSHLLLLRYNQFILQGQ